MRQPPPVATAVPLALRLHLASDAVVPPTIVTAALEWEALEACEVLDAHAAIEVHVRAALLTGQRRSVIEETAVVTGDGDVVPRYPGDGAEALPLTGSLFPGAHGRLPCAVPLGAAHPTVHTPSLDLTHMLVARVLLVGHDPIEVCQPIELHTSREGYADLERVPPASVHAGKAVPPAVEVPERHARPGGTVTGTAWPGERGPTTVSLRRASFVHPLGNPGSGPVAREDKVVAEVTFEPDGTGRPFTFTIPADAAPTCLTRFGTVRWMVRAETTAAAGRWGRKRAATVSFTEVELNVHKA